MHMSFVCGASRARNALASATLHYVSREHIPEARTRNAYKYTYSLAKGARGTTLAVDGCGRHKCLTTSRVCSTLRRQRIMSEHFVIRTFPILFFRNMFAPHLTFVYTRSNVMVERTVEFFQHQIRYRLQFKIEKVLGRAATGIAKETKC